MVKSLMGKNILVVEDEIVFRTLLVGYLHQLGATTYEASNGIQALASLEQQQPHVILCDLAMPEMGGIELVQRLRSQGVKTPIIVISATDKMADIAQVLRLGVADVLLKPLDDLNRLRESVLACLYPSLFSSLALEEADLLEDWAALSKEPELAVRLLRQLQPPVQMQVAHCQVNYRQLTSAEHPGLVLDIAALSEKDLAFYCLDVTRAEENGVLAALLLRAVFNGILQEHLADQQQRLPQMETLLKKVNLLLRQSHLSGQFPMLLGYYNVEYRNLILVSAGLHANLNAGDHQIVLNSGVPLGTLGATYINQISQRCDNWQCQVWGAGGRLQLMLSTE